MHALQITAETREQGMAEARRRLGLPDEALCVEWSQEEEELLAGARPMVQMTVTIREEYVTDRIVEVLRTLIEKMGITGEVTVGQELGMSVVSLKTDDDETLIGLHGETLDALQHMAIRMTGIGGREMPMVLIDVGDYRKRRIQRLRKVCQTLADLAVENGREEAFDPMSATDRKIVHTILKDIPGVKSYSKGEEYSRHVVVAPE